MEAKVVGFVFGTATGWDQSSDTGFSFYDVSSEFEQVNGYDLFVDIESGKCETYDDDGDVVFTFNFIDFVRENS